MKKLNEFINQLRNFLFVDKAQSEREYQQVKHCLQWCRAYGNGLLDETIYINSTDTRELDYDKLHEIPYVVKKLSEENLELKSKIKELEMVNSALMEDQKVVIILDKNQNGTLI